MLGRKEDEIEPDVRVPDGEGQAFVGVEAAVAVAIAGVDHQLDGLEPEPAA